MTPLDETRWRANPLVELRQFSALPAAQREQFRELEADAGFYGLFTAAPSFPMTVKAAPRPIAELFRSLSVPARLGAEALGDGEAAVDLVLDGVLEIESAGGFVSGADALPLLGPGGAEDGGALSRRALLHAQELETVDAQKLASALYRYNTIPITAAWKRRFASPEAVLAHAGAGRGALGRMLRRDWAFSAETDGWLAWTPLEETRRSAGDVTYKLYVAPRPEHIREAFEVLVRVLARMPVSFKLGNDAAGLLRPDKLVAYFATRAQLGEAAAAMQRELAGCEAQGVPFAAAWDDGGLLWWGIDPPESDRVLHWQQRESWRLWIAQRLGSAIALAKAARTASAAEPWRFALARVRRLGVDVASWTPSPALWSPS
jgi:hypothetical protein